MNEEQGLHITEGRHPVIERQLPVGETYVANDVGLHPDNRQILMVTGPNMSGKSALLRQTALISLMAQPGPSCPPNRQTSASSTAFCSRGRLRQHQQRRIHFHGRDE